MPYLGSPFLEDSENLSQDPLEDRLLGLTEKEGSSLSSQDVQREGHYRRLRRKCHLYRAFVLSKVTRRIYSL